MAQRSGQHGRSKRSLRQPSVPVRPHPNRLQQALDKVFELALITCLLLVPLTMAGIRDYGVAAFLMASLAMGASWAVRHILFPGPTAESTVAFILALLAIALVALQIQPLSPEWLSRLSPFAQKFFTLWGSESGSVLNLSGWQQISITPEATRSGLVLLIGYTIFFLSLVQHLRSQEQIQSVMKLVALSAVGMAMIGIGQALFGNDRFLWVIEHPTRFANWPAKGTFTNQNHFAQFLALGIGPLVWWWHFLQSADHTTTSQEGRRRSSSRRRSEPVVGRLDQRVSPILLACAGVVVLAAIMSLSRGGIVAFGVAALIVAAAVVRSWQALLKTAVPLVIFIGAALAAFGSEEIFRRWDQLRDARSLDDVDSARIALWTADAEAVREFWPAGAGVGSHADVYPIWMANHFGVRFSHAECGYLQVLLETGLPGLSLLSLGILLVAYWCLRAWRGPDPAVRIQTAALAAGLAASCLQSLVDFVWYIPACMISTLSLAACMCRCAQWQGDHLSVDSVHVARGPRLIPAVTALLLLATALPVGQLFADQIRRDVAARPHWDAYRIGIRRSVKAAERDDLEPLNNHLDQLIEHLETCSEADPFHHHAATALAPLYLQRFEQRLLSSDNALALTDLRDTVAETGFASQEEMHTWLGQVCGEAVQDLYRARHTARLALAGRPLRGESYIVLTETGFLDNMSSGQQEDLIRQAVRLRPHEPRVLYAAGLLASDSGHSEAAWKMWRRAIRLDSWVARQIFRRHLDMLPPKELIHRTDPTASVWSVLYDEYRKAGRQQHLMIAAESFADTFAEELRQNPAGNFHQLGAWAEMLLTAGLPADAVVCLKQGLRQHPRNIVMQRQLAKALAQHDDTALAHRELKWLRLRVSTDPEINRWYQKVEERMQASAGPGRTRIRSVSDQAKSFSENKPKISATEI